MKPNDLGENIMLNRKSSMIGSIISLVFGIAIEAWIIKNTASIVEGILAGGFYTIFGTFFWAVIVSFIFNRTPKRKMKKIFKFYVLIGSISILMLLYSIPILFLNEKYLGELPNTIRFILKVIGCIGFLGVLSLLVIEFFCGIKKQKISINEDNDQEDKN